MRFGLLALLFNAFSALVFLHVERAILLSQREQELVQIIEELPVAAAFLANAKNTFLRVTALQWKADSTNADWQGDSYRWKLEPEERTYIDSAPRWFGSVPTAMEIAGSSAGFDWRARVDTGDIAAVMDGTARLVAFYIFLNSSLLVWVVATWLSREVVRPITRLSENIQGVTSVDGFRPFSIQRQDEIGALHKSFNSLMGRLAASEAHNREHIQQLRAAYEQLERAQERLLSSEKLATLGRLSAGIAHEIGNPLSAVRGYLSLYDQLTPDEQSDILQRCRTETDRIDRIIRSLLDLARGRSGDAATVEEVKPFLSQLIERLSEQPAFKNIRFVLKLEDNLPFVPTAGGRLEQVLINLCLNAADAMAGVGTLTLSSSLKNTQVSLMIADTGPGIPEEDLPHIFEAFFTTKPAGQGTGLGLAVCRQIVEALGGTISAFNHNNGAAFLVNLPAVESAP